MSDTGALSTESDSETTVMGAASISTSGFALVLGSTSNTNSEVVCSGSEIIIADFRFNVTSGGSGVPTPDASSRKEDSRLAMDSASTEIALFFAAAACEAAGR